MPLLENFLVFFFSKFFTFFTKIFFINCAFLFLVGIHWGEGSGIRYSFIRLLSI